MGLSRNPKLCDTLNSPRQNYTETSRGDVKKTRKRRLIHNPHKARPNMRGCCVKMCNNKGKGYFSFLVEHFFVQALVR